MLSCIFEDGGKSSLRHVTVEAIVIRDNKLLLVKRAAHLSNGNKYAFPGGFLSRDETLEEGAIREVVEETGYIIKTIQLFRIIDKPDKRGEDRQNVNFCFLAEAGEKVKEPDNEVSEVKWFEMNNLPKEEEFAFDHYETISLYLKYQKEKLHLPIVK